MYWFEPHPLDDGQVLDRDEELTALGVASEEGQTVSHDAADNGGDRNEKSDKDDHEDDHEEVRDKTLDASPEETAETDLCWDLPVVATPVCPQVQETPSPDDHVTPPRKEREREWYSYIRYYGCCQKMSPFYLCILS